MVVLLPLSSSMDDGEAVNNASGSGGGGGGGGGGRGSGRWRLRSMAVDNEDGIQWQWTLKMAFNGSGSIRRRRRWEEKTLESHAKNLIRRIILLNKFPCNFRTFHCQQQRKYIPVTPRLIYKSLNSTKTLNEQSKALMVWKYETCWLLKKWSVLVGTSAILH
jgi:hypothetical protein